MARRDRAAWPQGTDRSKEAAGHPTHKGKARLGGGLASVALLTLLGGCSTVASLNPFARSDAEAPAQAAAPAQPAAQEEERIWDLFAQRGDAATTVRVNRYIWNAALDVLSFLPVETVDPFTGIIVTGYGTPPGGSRAYRATIHVSDPALDARALRLSVIGRDGQSVDATTLRALEDAILTRAREFRTRDAKL